MSTGRVDQLQHATCPTVPPPRQPHEKAGIQLPKRQHEKVSRQLNQRFDFADDLFEGSSSMTIGTATMRSLICLPNRKRPLDPKP